MTRSKRSALDATLLKLLLLLAAGHVRPAADAGDGGHRALRGADRALQPDRERLRRHHGVAELEHLLVPTSSGGICYRGSCCARTAMIVGLASALVEVSSDLFWAWVAPRLLEDGRILSCKVCSMRRWPFH